MSIMDSETSRGASLTVKYLQMGIWWFSVMIFVGYLMVWIVMPTNIFFPHWFPDIQAKADSIYFGRQGLSLYKSEMVEP